MRTAPRNSGYNFLKKLLKILYIILVVLCALVVASYIAYRLFVGAPDVGSQVTFPPQASASQPVESDLPEATQSPEPTPTPIVLTRQEGVYTCLLAGSDDGNGKADTIMLGVFNTNSKTASLISIPRDTLVSIYGHNYKINTAYGLGGMELLCDTVSDMLAIPVDYYVAVDLEAFAAIVDEIGGVWFEVPMDMDYEDPYQDLYIHVPKGYQLLNGEQALGVMRYRAGYLSQDLGRVQTQRALLTSLVSQTITLSNVTKVTSLIRILNTYVESNMPLDSMIYFATHAVGMNLDTALNSSTLPNEWIAPYIELVDEDVLDLVNSLGIYQETVPMEALNLRHN